MKFISLLISLLLFSHTSEAMQLNKRNNNAEKKKARYFKKCHKAIKKNDTQTLHHYLQYKLDVNDTDDDGKSLFYYACAIQLDNVKTKPYSIQALLYDEKLDINTHDAHQNTPLHIACRLGLPNIVERISQQNPETINAHNQDNQTPCDITRAQYDATYNKDKNTPLDEAQAKKYALCGIFLSKAQDTLDHKNNNSHNNSTKITSSLTVYYPYLEKIVRLLKKYGAHFNIEDNKEIFLTHICRNAGPKCISHKEATDLCTSPLNAMDLYYKDYNKIFNECLKNKHSSSYFYQQYSLMQYESLQQYNPLIRTLLHIAAQSTQLSLLKFTLKSEKLPKDVRQFIMLMYYHLNIHKIVAATYLLNETSLYKNDNDINSTNLYIELNKNPQPKLLWNKV